MKLNQRSNPCPTPGSKASPGPGAAAPVLRLLVAGAGQSGAAQRGSRRGAELRGARETPGGTDSKLSETPGRAVLEPYPLVIRLT